MPKTTAKPKAKSAKRAAGKTASQKETKKVAGQALGKKATKKAASKVSSKKAGKKKAANPLIPTRKRKGMLLLNPKPLTEREKAIVLRSFHLAYESHQKKLAEIADQTQEDS